MAAKRWRGTIITRMGRVRQWILVIAVLVFIASSLAYIARRDLKRAFVAVAIAHSHVFTVPPPEPGESRWQRDREAAEFYWDFSEIPIARQKRLDLLNPLLRPLVAEMNRRQSVGQDMHYSMHIYREVRWRLNFTPDVARTGAEIDLLRRSLDFCVERSAALFAALYWNGS